MNGRARPNKVWSATQHYVTLCCVFVLMGKTLPAFASLIEPLETNQKAWLIYQMNSNRLKKQDQEFIQTELNALQLTKPVKPKNTARFGFKPKQSKNWHTSAEGKRIADIVLSFQTPSGGWSKRTDMGAQARQPGENFGYESAYIPTFDNNATTTQMWFMADAFQATADPYYAKSFLRALDFLLLAQYPNGGWPQNFPLTGGYHNHITLNDDTLTNILSLLYGIVNNNPKLNFVPQHTKIRVTVALQAGIDCMLSMQVTVNGIKTLWGAQHDRLTLAPRSARKFEMAALATQESANLLLFLMQIKQPSPPMINAIDHAAQWFQQHKIEGYRWAKKGSARTLFPVKNSHVLWSRFIEIDSNKPIFGDKDGSVHYDVNHISEERRNKYAWYTRAPAKMLTHYLQWKKIHSY
ncbi:MAG: pectate lyase [Spongiibacteraceae bacterium]|nr:pectate lyase [Spongiibacteraceae bacterium]